MSRDALRECVAHLARAASIEINVQDTGDLAASRQWVAPGTKLYVSHLPRQTWNETVTACRAVREAGFDPAPHVPVRLLQDEETLDTLLGRFVSEAGVQEILLIAGDYAQPYGPFPTTMSVLRSGLLTRHGFKRISVAAHPEGHPKVALDELLSAALEKEALAEQAGLSLTFLTQFFFEHEPFVRWLTGLRAQGIRSPVVAGLAGPARLTTLFRFAIRCGVGPSMRALGARPTSLGKLIGDRGPDEVLRGLAESRMNLLSDFSGVHLFCFGGFLRTCEWLSAIRDSND